jgi:hypothetical protein
MRVTTTPAPLLDMVSFHIEAGAVYDFPQVVVATLEEAKQGGVYGEVRLTFRLADDSRGMYEMVRVPATWSQIMSCQNDTKTDAGVNEMARKIMNEYLASRYVY